MLDDPEALQIGQAAIIDDLKALQIGQATLQQTFWISVRIGRLAVAPE